MINLAFTALGGYAAFRLWNLNRGLAIATIICAVIHYASGRYMLRPDSGTADVVLNIALTVYLVVAFVLSFIIKAPPSWIT
ncbi:MAG: hypothetical protein L6427_02725 [Actinomycetia bacterium]|nr:hypothetical protein [Actinomycetes bacterium]